ncbi:MAG: ATP-binding cassette domain-containing protein [Hyphomicrobiales bacterium]|nr:ATP-binding cassette domain-containing protein [Hyphomicrobiales bacterium]
MSVASNVSVANLQVKFGAVRVLNELNIEVKQSEFVVLLGPSGCGKSTLLNAIAGLIDVSGGKVMIGGRDVTHEEPKDRNIAMVFQSYALYPTMSVRRNLSFGLTVAGMARPEITRRVQAAADLLKIGDLLDRRPSALSGGQRQRVAIGRALVREAPVYLFDEPLSNLDAQLRAELRVEIKRLHKRIGATIIFVTHDQIEALTLADRIAIMKGGKILQYDTPRTIYARPANLYVAGFIGSPAMNFIKGRLEASDDGAMFVNDDMRFTLRRPLPPGSRAGQAVTLGLRPEHVVAAGDGVAPLGMADVELLETMGADSLAWCRIGACQLTTRLDGAAQNPGRIALGADPAEASLFDSESGDRL